MRVDKFTNVVDAVFVGDPGLASLAVPFAISSLVKTGYSSLSAAPPVMTAVALMAPRRRAERSIVDGVSDAFYRLQRCVRRSSAM